MTRIERCDAARAGGTRAIKHDEYDLLFAPSMSHEAFMPQLERFTIATCRSSGG